MPSRKHQRKLAARAQQASASGASAPAVASASVSSPAANTADVESAKAGAVARASVDAALFPKLREITKLHFVGDEALNRGRHARAAETYMECVALAQQPDTCAADSFVLAYLYFEAGTMLLAASQEKQGSPMLRSDPRGVELLAKGISQLRKCIAVVDARVSAGTAFEVTSEEFVYACEDEELSKNFLVLHFGLYLNAAMNLHSAACTELPEDTSYDGLLPTLTELLSVFQRGAALVKRGE